MPLHAACSNPPPLPSSLELCNHASGCHEHRPSPWARQVPRHDAPEQEQVRTQQACSEELLQIWTTKAFLYSYKLTPPLHTTHCTYRYSDAADLKKCGHCSKTESSLGLLLTCGACGCRFYCNRECQKADWRRHKTECKEVCAPHAAVRAHHSTHILHLLTSPPSHYHHHRSFRHRKRTPPGSWRGPSWRGRRARQRSAKSFAARRALNSVYSA